MLIPCNRYLLIEKKLKKEEKEHILLPEEYIKSKSKLEEYSWYKIKKISDEIRSLIDAEEEDEVLVENSMIKKINVNNEQFYFVLYNYVIAFNKKRHYLKVSF